MSWLKSLYPVIKQKNYCHELRFHVKSFSSYWDQLGRTLADLMKDGVKMMSLYLDCFGKTSRLYVSPVWLVLFLSTVGLFLCLLSFFMLFPCLIWLVTPQNLLLLSALPFCSLSTSEFWNGLILPSLEWVCNLMPFEYAMLQAKLYSLQACHKFSCQFLARKIYFLPSRP